MLSQLHTYAKVIWFPHKPNNLNLTQTWTLTLTLTLALTLTLTLTLARMMPEQATKSDTF